ncbi:MAG: TRAP transporter substrate-binding protein [Acetobacterales bacterium]
MFKHTLMSCAFAAAIALVHAGGASAATELRFGHAQPPGDTVHKAAEHFKQQVEKGSNGEIVVNVFPAGQLGSNKAMVEGIRLGTLDITANGNPFWTGFNPVQNVLDLPYLFESYEHAYRVLDGDVGRNILKGLESKGVKGIAFWEIGFRNVTNNVRPIEKPEDLKGIKVRTTPNKAHVKAFQLLGANPVTMSFTDVYMALQTGTVDAQENPVGLIYSNRFNEVQKHLSLTRHAYTPYVFAMNLAKFNALSPEHQKLVLDAGISAAERQRQANRDLEEGQLAELKKSGMQVIEDVDPAPFRKIVYEPVKADYVAEHGSELVDRIIALGTGS